MANVQFCGEDPLLLDAQLTEEERMIRMARADGDCGVLNAKLFQRAAQQIP